MSSAETLRAQFESDIAIIDKWKSKLDVNSFYVAFMTNKNLAIDIGLESICRFLASVHSAYISGLINDAERSDVEFSSYRGLIGEAKTKLKLYCKNQVQKAIEIEYREPLIQPQRKALVEEKKQPLAVLERPRVELGKANMQQSRPELIGKLQSEWEQEERRRLALDEKMARDLQEQLNLELIKLVPKPALMLNCHQCGGQVIEADLVMLEGCSHVFHQYCITQHLYSSIQRRVTPLRCSVISCSQEVDMQDVTKLLDRVTVSLYEDYSMRQCVVHSIEDSQFCLTPGCSYIFCSSGEIMHFRCPKCSAEYCLKCKCIYHYGISCQEYSRRRMFGLVQHQDLAVRSNSSNLLKSSYPYSK